MLDPLLLRTFLTVAQGNSFSETARKLDLRQSTVSDHIRRLEQELGRRLFLRDTHSVALTPEGDALIGYARLILDTSERARQFFAGTRLRGRLRFGASEDLVVSFLPTVLKSFTRDHPEIDLELTVALSTVLISGFDAGEFDLVFCKRWPGEDRGELVCRDDIVWVGQQEMLQSRPSWATGTLPLILYRPPSITRSIATAALARAEIGWRLACTSDSLSGLVAAVQAGLGVTVLAKGLIPSGLADIETAVDLPRLGALEFILLRNTRLLRAPAEELATAIITRARS